MDIEKIKQAFDDIEGAMRIFNKGPIEFYLNNLIECREEFFNRCAPFKVGDIVELTKYPNTDNGWRGCAHFLIPGAKGEIREVDFSKGKFIGSVYIFNQTWIDGNGNTHPIDNGHLFDFNETYLRVVNNAESTPK